MNTGIILFINSKYRAAPPDSLREHSLVWVPPSWDRTQDHSVPWPPENGICATAFNLFPHQLVSRVFILQILFYAINLRSKDRPNECCGDPLCGSCSESPYFGCWGFYSGYGYIRYRYCRYCTNRKCL